MRARGLFLAGDFCFGDCRGPRDPEQYRKVQLFRPCAKKHRLERQRTEAATKAMSGSALMSCKIVTVALMQRNQAENGEVPGARVLMSWHVPKGFARVSALPRRCPAFCRHFRQALSRGQKAAFEPRVRSPEVSSDEQGHRPPAERREANGRRFCDWHGTAHGHWRKNEQGVWEGPDRWGIESGIFICTSCLSTELP